MDTRFDRLLSEQQSAMKTTDAKIAQLTQFSKDYSSLKLKLEELAKDFSRKTLIPFSSRALVPATLIHTNEVLVYLGGDHQHAAEVSTFQALQILDRRIERVADQIKQLQEQRKLLSDREAFTSKFHAQGKTESQEAEEFEIREEYDLDREKEWLQKHKTNVQAEKREMLKSKQAAATNIRFTSDSDSSSSYEEPVIVFRHSNHPTSSVINDITDWSAASPADVCKMIQKHVEINKRKAVSKSCLKKEKKHPLNASPVNDSPEAAKTVSFEPTPLHDTIREGPALDEARHDAVVTRESPFSSVVERDAVAPSMFSDLKVNSGKPVSKFRALRKQQN